MALHHHHAFYTHSISGHGVELPFVFHTATLAGFNYTQAEMELANNMVLYWTNFAHYGDPNGAKTRKNKVKFSLCVHFGRIKSVSDSVGFT